MKIAFYVNNSLSGGGAERVVANLANAFSENGYDVTVITSTITHNEYTLNSSIKRELLEEKNNYRNIILRALNRIYILRSILKKNNIKVLFAFLDGAVIYSVLATRFSNVKVVVSKRNDPRQYYKMFYQKFWIRTIYDLANAAVFQTPDARSWFNISIQKRSKIIYNPVRDEFYDKDYVPIINNIVTFGRYVSQKNHHMLIDAMAIAIKKFPELKLSIFGSGKLKTELQNHIVNKGLTNNIILKENTLDVSSILRTAEIFVLSSDFEGAPNALMEAMAVGVPSISTDCPCGGPKMLLGDNENGCLVPVANVECMAEAICKLHIDKQRQMVYSQRSKIYAERFRINNVFREWQSIIDIALR